MFEVQLENPAQRFLRKRNKEEQIRIIKKLKQLKRNSELGKPLTGRLSGLWSLRFGKYRALYQIKKNRLLIMVLGIGHRKNIY